jgi:hypothetical protein
MSQDKLTLVVHTGGIGDLLLAAPAFGRLAEEGALHLAGRPERLNLLVAGGIAREAYNLDVVDFSSIFAEPSEQLAQFVRPYGRAIVWMRDDDGRIVGTLRGLGVEAEAFPGLPPADWSGHASDYYFECLGFEPDPSPFRLEIPAVAGYDVIIHPGSGSPRKNLPLDRFVEFAKLLESHGRQVAWSVGPAEEGFALPEGPRLAQLPLPELAAYLAGAQLFIGNDSGITHLAAVVGCPTIAYFGPTDPTVWAPRGQHVEVRRFKNSTG